MALRVSGNECGMGMPWSEDGVGGSLQRGDGGGGWWDSAWWWAIGVVWWGGGGTWGLVAASDPTTITSWSSLRSSLIFMSFFTFCSRSPELVSFLSLSLSFIGSGCGIPILIPASLRTFFTYGEGDRWTDLRESSEERLSVISFPGERLSFTFMSPKMPASRWRSSNSFSGSRLRSALPLRCLPESFEFWLLERIRLLIW